MFVESVTVEGIRPANLVSAFPIFQQRIQGEDFIRTPGSAERQPPRHQVKARPHARNQAPTRQPPEQLAFLIACQVQRTCDFTRAHSMLVPHLGIGEKLGFLLSERTLHN